MYCMYVVRCFVKIRYWIWLCWFSSLSRKVTASEKTKFAIWKNKSFLLQPDFFLFNGEKEMFLEEHFREFS